MKRLFTGITVVVFALAAAGIMSAQSDPRIGTWKLNVEKSKISNAPLPKSETRTYEASGDAITMHADIVNGDGSKQSFGDTTKDDGKDYPYTGQQPNGLDTISVKRVGKTIIAENKKDGKVLFTTTMTFSKDGKVMTWTLKGKNENGQPVNNVRVYDKQ